MTHGHVCVCVSGRGMATVHAIRNVASSSGNTGKNILLISTCMYEDKRN